MVKKIAGIALWGGLFFSMAWGGQIIRVNLSGSINDAYNKSMPGAVVHLMKLDLWDTTDAKGSFSIVKDVPLLTNVNPKEQIPIAPTVRHGYVSFSVVQHPAMVSVTLLDLKGRIVCKVVDRKLTEGAYNVPITGKGLLAGQIYIASIAIGNTNTLIKAAVFESGVFSIAQKSVQAKLDNTAIAKVQASAPAIDTIVIKKVGFLSLVIPISSYQSQLGMQRVKSSTIVEDAPKALMQLIMTSTGADIPDSGTLHKHIMNAAGEENTDTFMYPVQQWVPSMQWAGCPEFLELTVKKIAAYGLWNKIIISKDTTIAGSDSVITKTDTISEAGYEILWQGSKKVRFTGAAADLSGFDSLSIPSGTIYSISVYSEPFALIKGSITADFITNSSSEEAVTKTVYTKYAYAWDGYAHTGGSMDASVFETEPAESTLVILNSHSNPNNGNLGFGIQTSCTTAVSGSISLTMFLDISRTLFYTLSDTSRFYSDPAFIGNTDGNIEIATVFPGKCGRVDGYQYIYVTNNDNEDVDEDGSSPPLNSEMTLGYTGWMNLVFDNTGRLVVGNAFRDNDWSVGPWGRLSNYDTEKGNFKLGSKIPGAGQSQISGFRHAQAVGHQCVTRVYQPSIIMPDGKSSHKRSGQAKFILKIRQE